jgi:hypothetical protein
MAPRRLSQEGYKGLSSNFRSAIWRSRKFEKKTFTPTISMRSQFANKVQAKRPLPLGSLSQKNVSAKWWGVLDVLTKFLSLNIGFRSKI